MLDIVENKCNMLNAKEYLLLREISDDFFTSLFWKLSGIFSEKYTKKALREFFWILFGKTKKNHPNFPAEASLSYQNLPRVHAHNEALKLEILAILGEARERWRRWDLFL